ncbi:uncharacterized protein LOC114575789 [Exaiptasia diaphana]|uniref:Secreted protein n=1 Tax=Exaiptasia diaphana TaxID=2652724 RepID=A0A913YRH6_EXADI|nr:uncharacterized protein LOC114575789 [Exaiptasia diaphana]
MIFKKIVTICLISMFAATVIASRSRRQAVNCTPQEMKELKSVGINLEKSKIDCSAAISAPVADKHKSSQQKGEKQNDGGRRCIKKVIGGQTVEINQHEGQYCCSPACDAIMKRMGCPYPVLASCT